MIEEEKVAVISMVRNDTFFADKWISYYGAQFGFENLFLFVDGMDQNLPKQAGKINCFQIPHQSYKRAKGDRVRARMISNFAKDLFSSFKVVLAMDIDEFLVIDPKKNISLKAYLLQDFSSISLSALGIDVGQHPEIENAVDLKKSFLSQRKFGQISDRYTKPVVAFEPLTWGSGFHRIKGKDYTLDPNLYLFHFGLVDMPSALNNSEQKEIQKAGWAGHLARRFKLYQALKEEKPHEGDPFFVVARKRLSKNRKWYTFNKPAPLKGNTVIKIPERFNSIV